MKSIMNKNTITAIIFALATGIFSFSNTAFAYGCEPGENCVVSERAGWTQAQRDRFEFQQQMIRDELDRQREIIPLLPDLPAVPDVPTPEDKEKKAKCIKDANDTHSTCVREFEDMLAINVMACGLLAGVPVAAAVCLGAAVLTRNAGVDNCNTDQSTSIAACPA